MLTRARRIARSGIRRLETIPFVRRWALAARFGDLRRTHPLAAWGYRRGTPVDRAFIDAFLLQHADAVHGRVLEVKDDHYSTQLGASLVEVVDSDPANTRATRIGDLCDAQTLAPAEFDGAIITQTLQYLADPRAAVANVVRSVRPGGSVLLTVPCLGRADGPHDLWRFTPAGLRRLLHDALADSGASIEVVSMGNGLAARAFLFGLAADDLDPATLATDDGGLPLVAGARVRLP